MLLLVVHCPTRAEPDDVSPNEEREVDHTERGGLHQHVRRTQRLLNQHFPLTSADTHNTMSIAGCSLSASEMPTLMEYFLEYQ